ncbi:HAD family hydrolase [Ignisphaera sp. 4213-co]|uniref:HAD family hydrolase n=1 Tax=Ignisphaera cupida TaxID=3050454 RepID=A0ABD4Z734_9CREN|nr:HAD family hydrolase [Ignisphaera sp. 4213-co]MDK6029015.1 HAD family hydrolase [Ignisphaera sp. 4213-co]
MVSVHALSFDVWNTLLDINKIFNLISIKIAELSNGLSSAMVMSTILNVYEKCKTRRRLGEVDGFNIVIESQNILAEELGLEISTILKAIAEAFEEANPREIIFSDAITTLELLHRLGFRLGIIGNTVFWSSIYTINLLKRLGIYNLFEVTIFSDETRINKPDRRIFLMFSKNIGLEPSKIAHVGDSVIEDVGGALSAGMKAIHIDRRRGKNKVILRDIGLALIGELTQVIDALEEL